MKRLLSTCICVCLIAGFAAGCTKKKEEKAAEDTKVVLLGSGFAKDSEEFSKNIDKFFSVLKYQVSESEESVRYVLYDEEEEEIERDYDGDVVFDDSSSILLPVSYEELETQGWITFARADTQISNKKKQPVSFTNENDEKIILQTIYTEGIDYDGVIACDLSDCTFYQMEINPYIDVEDSDENEANEDCPAFLMGKTVTKESGLDDVLNEFGEPNVMEFFNEDATIKVVYEKMGTAKNELTLEFCFNGIDNTMESVKIACKSDKINW